MCLLCWITRRFGSASSNELASTLPTVNGHETSPDLERIKQEILEEMRRDLQKMKVEIIDGRLVWGMAEIAIWHQMLIQL